MSSKDADKGKDKEKSKAKPHPQGDGKQQKAEAKAAKEKDKEKDKKAKEGDAAKAAKEEKAKEEKPKAPPRPPADPRLKVLKKFHGRFLPRGPLRDRLKGLMDRWNSGEDHGGVTVEELKALHNDWTAARQKPSKKKATAAVEQEPRAQRSGAAETSRAILSWISRASRSASGSCKPRAMPGRR